MTTEDGTSDEAKTTDDSRAYGSPLFVYGTLMFPGVLQTLLHRVPRYEAASAPGWRAAALGGRTYPGLVPHHGSVSGRLLLDLSDRERAIIDEFEDNLYDLQRIELSDGRAALTYVWRDPTAVLDRDWDPDHFATTALADYMR